MSVYGNRNATRKLSPEDVTLIRQVYEEGKQYRQKWLACTAPALAEKFDVHQRTIEKVINYESHTRAET